MKFFKTLVLLLIYCSAHSQKFLTDTITPLQAKKFVGQEVCVCGKVVSTHFVANSKTGPTYINLDKKYPQQIFTLMIFGADRKNFSYKPEEFLQGKNICVKGKVTEYKGLPQIIATKQIQVGIQ